VRRDPSGPKESAGQNARTGQTELVGQSDPKVQIVQVDQSVPKVQIVLVGQKGLRTVGEAHEMIAADAIAALVNPVPATNVEICRHIPNRFLNQPDSVQDCTMMMMTLDFAMSRFFRNKTNSCWLTMTTRMHLVRRLRLRIWMIAKRDPNVVEGEVVDDVAGESATKRVNEASRASSQTEMRMGAKSFPGIPKSLPGKMRLEPWLLPTWKTINAHRVIAATREAGALDAIDNGQWHSLSL
jgi:hypothetical protein